MPISSRRNSLVELKIGDRVRVLSKKEIEKTLDEQRHTIMPNGNRVYWNNSMYRFCGKIGFVRGFDHIDQISRHDDTGRIHVQGYYYGDEDMLSWSFCRNWLELV